MEHRDQGKTPLPRFLRTAQDPPASNDVMRVAEDPSGSGWMDAAFERLLSRCNVVRPLVTLWGASALYWQYLNIEIYSAGHPRLDSPFFPIYRYGVAFCWIEPHPLPGFLLSLGLLMPSILGSLFVWLRPRIGFLLTAIGWICIWGAPILHSHSKEDGPASDGRWITVLLLVLLCLILAAYKAGTLGRSGESKS